MSKLANIVAVYGKANEEEVKAGLSWYADVHTDAVRIAEERGLPLPVVAAIIAALSPGLTWEKNVEAAERIIRGENLTGMGLIWPRNIRKAKAILKGRDIRVVLQGRKVRSFAYNIENPFSPLAVTIDVHAYSVWAGRRFTTATMPNISEHLYQRIVDDYVKAAREIGILPLQLQAITWLCRRRLNKEADIAPF